MTERDGSAVVILSGGLDSTVSLAMLCETHTVVRAITFDYGQRARLCEMKAAAAIAAHYNVPHQVITLDWLGDMLPEDLQGSRAVESLAHRDGLEMGRVWVPNRNGVFLNIAAAVAEAYGAGAIAFGANADEGRDFPDNTPAYRDALNAALQYSTRNGVRVVTPVGHLTKAAMVAEAVRLKAPLESVWSCYGAGPRHCGECPSCTLLQGALKASAPEILAAVFH
ncbi:MAG: 7-cyano-7-deazaguanine synthase QueC [Candidatus Melainabacteria bacterium]